MSKTNDICYLCGGLVGTEADKDHVPPKQFYAKGLRKSFSPNLFTLPVHPSCNKSYQKDEDYFVHSIGPLAMKSHSGNALWRDISNSYDRPQSRRLAEMVLREFDRKPSGIVLPFRKVAKRPDWGRIRRVVWKITRGLFFKEVGHALPPDLPIKFDVFSPDENPPSEYNGILTAKPLGDYPGVLDYRYIGIPERMYLWAMLFRDSIVMFVGFHVPGCTCKNCIEKTEVD